MLEASIAPVVLVSRELSRDVSIEELVTTTSSFPKPVIPAEAKAV